ncbi:choline dehydrogenase [Temperatibacter marinus]|uniref:Choline dehydrogenase n=1 Tax=Temperatibacter marinus TaxID=1456591 RepID=A0AA52H9M1_9PROT|nr:choline dehydrogenase [Temperatibacter marinus]WND02662.1 choline dehydrogenase [Temperatibacter marinus]
MKTEFDFIVVGAGSAGCVLANRLSANGQYEVLLIEAGKADKSLAIHVPAMLGEEISSTRNNWFYWTEPQKHLNNRKLFWPRGKVLGGSSSLNGMVYIRGHARDYDEWAQLGCKGWSFSDVLPYFKKSESFEEGADSYHGGDGPLNVGPRTSDNPLNDAFLASGLEAGFKESADFNGADQEGFAPFQQTIKEGRRWSTAAAFLKPVMDRANLTVLTGALTRRVVIEKGKAVGVEVDHKKKTLLFTARRETVLCGGAINSPQLLMLSGIGDEKDLRGHGIAVNKHLPAVGKNMQDHLDTTVTAYCKQPITMKRYKNPYHALTGLWKWFRKKPGFMSDIIVPTGAFLKSDAALERPDIQFHMIMAIADEPHGFAYPKHHGFGIHSCVLRPRSTGTISLKSSDPHDHALIDPNYLADPYDLEIARAGARMSAKVLTQPAFSPFFERFEEHWEGILDMSDDMLNDVIRAKSETIYHPTSTCTMGAADHPMSVVDPSLKVIGIENLRVADASVMPRLIGGNTNAPTIMIGEKCADMMLDGT